MEALLKATEVSALTGISVQYVRRLAKEGRYTNVQIQVNSHGRACYLIPLSALPEQAQKKYIDQHRPVAMDAPTKHSGKKQGSATRPLESYSGEERAEISYWLTLVDRWQEYRRKAGGRKAEFDESFVRLTYLEDPLKRQISVETLYRKWAAIRAGDLDALVDKRGKARKGKTVLLPEIEQEFLSLYLDEAQLPIPRCVALTEQWARDNMPTALPLPSYHTFYRKAKAVPYAVAVLCREGEKAYYDKCSPYIRREYESISANDFWIGDTHTLDVESMGPDGTLHRLYLSAWLDARSGIFTGWYVTASPGSQATLNALRKGIAARGIPLNVYVDNGREFLTYDIGGRGHRAKKRLADGSEPFAPPGVFERLGIKMTNAIVRNARAKLVERRFEDFKNYVSRLFPTYTGGNVVEKPNRLKYVLKQGDHVPTDAEVIAAVDTLIEGYLNCEPYGGSVAEDKGKSRVDVWRENLPNGAVRKPASETDLQLMFFDCQNQFEQRGYTDIQRAARSIYLIKMSFGSDRCTFATAPKIASNISVSFSEVQERLRKVIIEHLDFERLITIYDRPGALFYCDPPYIGTERYYRAGFSQQDHERLASVLHGIKGKFLLSYNDCIEHLDRICEALGCRVEDVLEYVPSQQKKTGQDLILEDHGNRKEPKK